MKNTLSLFVTRDRRSLATSLLRLSPLILVLIVLTGCGSAEPVDPTPSPFPTPTPQPPTPTPLPEGASVAAHIRARGELRVGVRYDLYPFGFITDDGELSGFEVDLGRELARRWLGDPEAVSFQQVRSDTALHHLTDSDVDIVLAALIHTQERETAVDFSIPYFEDGQAFLIRSANTGAIQGLEDLQGRPVGVLSWTDSREALESAAPFTPTLQIYNRFDTAVSALGTGEVDAVAELRKRLYWGIDILDQGAIVGQYTHVPVAVAFPENEPFLADLVNVTLQEMFADGTYAEICAEWFPEDLTPLIDRWPGEESVFLADAPVTFNEQDTVSAIQLRGHLLVAMPTDRSPFSMADANGAPAGYEVSLVREMAKRWMGESAAVEFITTTVDGGKEMVRTGQADVVIGGVPHTRAAELNIDFSLPTYIDGEGFLVRAGTTITDAANLDGQSVVALAGSDGEAILQSAAQEAGVTIDVRPATPLNTALTLLDEEQVIAVVGKRSLLQRTAHNNPALAVLPLQLTREPLALGLPPGDSNFRDLVNLTLQGMKADGSWDDIYNTWFTDSPPEIQAWPGAPNVPLHIEVEPVEEPVEENGG